MKVLRFESEANLFSEAAIRLLETRPRTLGLAAGRTPEKLYREICQQHQGELTATHFFHLDEFLGLNSQDPESFGHQMRSLLLEPLQVPEPQIHLMNGRANDPASEALRYESQIQEQNGIQLQILGLGLNGHLAFNEPGSPRDSRTRPVRLTEVSRKANQYLFENHPVPEVALTMGLGTILEAEELWLLVPQREKFPMLEKAMKGPITTEVPASHLQQHRNTTIWTL